jgi:hypothetical protein
VPKQLLPACKKTIHIERAALMTEYFGNYKPGAYWIYLNRDSTKRDSVWVDNFKVNKLFSMNSCLTADEVSFDFHSIYFYVYEKTIKLSLEYNGDDLYTNTLMMNNEHWLCNTRDGVDNFYLSGAIDTSGNPIVYPTVSNYLLWPNDSQTHIPKVSIIMNRIIIAPSVGIVQFMPTNLNDTFSLIKYWWCSTKYAVLNSSIIYVEESQIKGF